MPFTCTTPIECLLKTGCAKGLNQIYKSEMKVKENSSKILIILMPVVTG